MCQVAEGLSPIEYGQKGIGGRDRRRGILPGYQHPIGLSVRGPWRLLDKYCTVGHHSFLKREGHVLEEGVEGVFALRKACDTTPIEERGSVIEGDIQQSCGPVANSAHRLLRKPEIAHQGLEGSVDGKIEHWAVSPRHEDTIEIGLPNPGKGSSSVHSLKCVTYPRNVFGTGVATGVNRRRTSTWTRNRYLKPRLGENGIWLRKFGKPNSRTWLSVNIAVARDDHQQVLFGGHAFSLRDARIRRHLDG